MRKVIVSKKSGFLSDIDNVVIIDSEGKKFYSYTPKDRKFNLPCGTYYTNAILIPISPISYKLPELPKRRKRSKLNVSDFKIKVTENPNKASIYLNSGIIEIDKNYWQSLGKLGRDFTILHEFGHLFYKSEKNADLYASCQMLKIGYNPSQVFQATKETFSFTGTNILRCENVLNNLID